MATLLRALGMSALVVLTAQARAQMEAPPGGGVGIDIAPPGGGTATVDIAPPGGGTGSTSNGGPLLTVQANQPMTTNAMIGYVNAEPVFLSDLFRPIDANLRRLAVSSSNAGDFKTAARVMIRNQLSTLVSETLVVSAATAQLSEQDKGRIEIYLALEKHNLIGDHGGSEAAAERSLQASGSSVDKEMRDKQRKVIRDLYFQKNLMPHVVVTRQMVVDAYDKDPKRWQQVAQVELSTITLPITRWLTGPSASGDVKGPVLTNPTAQQIKDAEAAALAAGREIVAQLKAGADFARMVEDKNSRDDARLKGGSRGLVNRGSMLDAKLEEYMFSLPANSIGEPFLSHDADFHNSTLTIVKVGKKKEARTVQFDEAQSSLFDELRQQQLRDLENQEMTKLSEGAAIEAVDRMLDVALDAAVTRYAIK